ncbi:MAG: SusC/RagA family protein [Bacteroidetes bacterium]|nr:MAG: SusC/RagA family protein [Bacteroidota bacterium]PTM14304.1 MAG: SusC/RagA family protein [Bacteroidota bacterium]
MKKILNSILLLAAIVLVPGLALSQRTITGQVTDAETGETLIGANILVVGTATGTISDFDGNFELKLPAGFDMLSFSYTGYTSQDIKVGASNVINVKMAGGQILDEVVVIGYGTIKREDATGSVETISSESFNRGAITSTQELIAGKVAGVSITPNSDPGGGASIRIRGGSSLNASNDPLIVIDGVPIESRGVAGDRNILNLVNPNDVENVTVLKDASATAIYGSRASNGVIIITTKKGALGKAVRLSYNGSFAASSIQETVDVMSADQFRTLVNERYPANVNLLGNENTNWQDQIFQTGITHDHNMSASGALGELPYRVSLGYTNKDGLLKTDNFQRLTYGVSLTPGFLDNTLQVTANVKGMNNQNLFANRGALGSAVSFDPTQPIFDQESPYGGYFTFVNNDGTPNRLAPANPLAQLELKDDQSTVNRFIGNVQVDYRIPFLPDLRANINVGIDQAKGDGTIYEPANFSAVFDAATGGGTDNSYNETITNQLFDFYLNYVKELGNNKIDLMAGYGYQHFKFEKEDNRSDLQGTPENVVQILTAREYFLVSVFSRLNLSLGDRLLLTGTVRRDGTSRFSEKNRYGIFPAAAVGYKFIDNKNPTGIINSLKLRAGWGITGQQDMGDNFYPYIPTYTISLSNANYQFGDEFVPTNRPGGYNSDLKWEETTTYNVGVDFGLFDDRLSGSFEVYQRDTEDLLTTTRPAAGTNLTNNIPANIGSLENKGFEVSLNIVPIRNAKAEWSLGVNLTRNQNEITSLTLGDDPNFQGFETGGISGGVGNNIQIHSVGFPASSFYVYQQVYNENGNPIEGLYVDRNGDGQVTPGDRYRFENPAPEYFLGFTSNFNYGAFDFSFAGRANVGNYMYNNRYVNSTNYNSIYNSTGFLSNVHSNINAVGFAVPQYFSDFFLEDASFLRIDHITAGYRIQDVFGATRGGNLRLYATIQNPVLVTNYTGIDPEVFGGIDNDIYPRSRTVLFGVNLNF